MTHRIGVVRHDRYHPASVVDPAVAQVFGGREWEVASTGRIRDLIDGTVEADLAVFFTNGQPEGEADLDEAEQLELVQRVRQGMGMLRVHAGLVLIEPESPLYERLNTGRFVSHPEHQGSVEFPVAYVPLRQSDHPILAGVETFGGRDEHYWCQVEVGRTDPLLAATSAVGTSVAGWAHEVEAGRVASLVPGHTPEVLMHPMMLRLLANAARWCVHR